MTDHPSPIEKKIERIQKTFLELTAEEKIQYLLQLGRSLPAYPDSDKTPEYLVSGCQSTLYLSSRLENGKVILNACADALISSGLAALLIAVYSGETPQTILNTPPRFLQDIGILSSLSPSRSNGLAHIHQKIKNNVLNILLSTTKTIEP